MLRLIAALLMAAPTVVAAHAPAQFPANDDLAAAELLLDVPLIGETNGATDEPGEVAASCGATVDEPGVWYVLPEAAAPGVAVVDTIGSDELDTVLSVWVGAGHPLTQVACSDDAAADLWSRVAIEVEPGMTYFVKVSGIGGAEGPFVVNATVAIPPPNDYLGNAMAIEDPTAFQDEQNTVGATHEIDEDVSACGLYAFPEDEASVWYTLTTPDDAVVRLSTEGSDFDTVLSVWVGGPEHPLTEFSCNDDDDAGFQLWSSLAFTAQAGVPYFVKVAGADTDTGHLVIGTPPWTIHLPFAYRP